MFEGKGKRLLLIGGVAVVGLGVASFVLIGGDSKSEPQARQQPAATSGKAQVERPNAKPATEAGPGAEAPEALTAGAPLGGSSPARVGPATTAPDVPARDGLVAVAQGAEDGVFDRRKYTYRSMGRVDPFQSLIVAKDGAQRLFAEKLDPDMIKLVGILTNGGERRALVEDVHGFGYVLKEGDRVLRGRVVSIGQESVKIRHTIYGVTETTTLSLVKKSQGRGLPNDRLR